MNKLWNYGVQFWKQHQEGINYLFFGGLTTLVNIVGYWVLNRIGLPTEISTTTATVASILFAYFTNRRWVFQGARHGVEAWREFGSFVFCRLGTLVLDLVIMLIGVDVLGPKLVDGADMEWWKMVVKIFSNVLVVIVNYVFSKLFVFRKK